MNTAEYIEKYKVICICRRIYGEDLLRLARALNKGGVRMMEVTFDQADPDGIRKTAEAIRMLKREMKDSMKFGAGTVLNCEQVQAAFDAGAEYIISPNTNEAVIRRTRELGMVSMPGAMTPTEILQAHDAGANFVKLFPTGWLGLKYLKDIMGPINHIKLIATGGITEENFGEFLKAGMVGAGVSSRLVDKKLREQGNYEELTARARKFTEIAES